MACDVQYKRYRAKIHVAVPPQARKSRGCSVMRRYLVLGFAAVVLAITAPAAFATRVVFDPPTVADPLPPVTAPFCTHSDPCSIPPDLATDDCPESLPSPGELFTVSFFAHPPLPNRTDFYLFTDFVNSPGVADVTLSAPEAGELCLSGLGLLLLGIGYGWQRRRRQA